MGVSSFLVNVENLEVVLGSAGLSFSGGGDLDFPKPANNLVVPRICLVLVGGLVFLCPDILRNRRDVLFMFLLGWVFAVVGVVGGGFLGVEAEKGEALPVRPLRAFR